MAEARIPANQQNALPLLTVAAATSPTEVFLVGSSIIKRWGGTDFGISNSSWSVSPNALRGYIQSNWLDLRGLNHFSIVIRRRMENAAAEAVQQPQLWAEGRGPTGTTNPNEQYNGTSQRMGLADFGANWLVTGGPYPYSTYSARGFTINSYAVAQSAPGGTQGAFVGTDLRFVLEASSPAGGPALLWTGTLWGQGK